MREGGGREGRGGGSRGKRERAIETDGDAERLIVYWPFPKHYKPNEINLLTAMHEMGHSDTPPYRTYEALARSV